MKKVLSIFLTVFCIGISNLYADNDNSTECTIPINMKKNAFQTGIERSMSQYVDAYLHMDSYTITMDFYGLGDGEVYIVDANGAIFDSDLIVSGMSSIVLNAPEANGNYYLVVCCANYYGEGNFTIE